MMIALGSNSQTRAKILTDAGLKFIQRGCDFDENKVISKEAKEFVYQVTKGKYARYLELYALDMPFIVADTVVEAEGEILLKAKDIQDARRMLSLQSGNEVAITTCMIYKSSDFELIDLSQTRYEFAKFDDSELEAYLEGGEWEGKAGACMVEGFCKPYIKSVIGLESTAMGLSVERLLPFLELKC